METRDVCYKGATIISMGSHGTLMSGDILIRDGKIIDIDKNIEVGSDIELIHLEGTTLIPGIIDAHSHIGIFEQGIGEAGVDGNEENDPITPQMRAIDGCCFSDPEFRQAAEGGVTTVATGPGSGNPIGGQFMALKMKQGSVKDRVINDAIAMKMAFGENPKFLHGKKGKVPSTRMGVAAIIRETLFKAREYDQRIRHAKDKACSMPAFDMKLEALRPVISGEMIVKAHAHRADDILTAIRIRDEFNLRMTIEHATEAHLIKDAIIESKIPLILGPYLGFPHKNEVIRQNEEAAGILEKAGVDVAIMTDLPAMHSETLRVCAGICIQKGMSPEGALAAITINAAKALGLEDRIGSLEIGKDADFAVFDRDPLCFFNSHCLYTVIDGNIVYKNNKEKR